MPIVSVDASQIEWRIAALLSQDPVMLSEIRGGIDQHAAACVELMELPLTSENRTDAKIFNFRMIYYGSAYAFYADSKMPNFSLKKWEKIVDNFYKKYKGLYQWWMKIFKEVNKSGRLINPTGRILKFEKVKKGNGLEYNKSNIANYPVQSLAAEVIQMWMVKCYRELCHIPEIKMVMQVHDELVWDCPKKYVDLVARTCYTNLITMPEVFGNFFKFDFNVPLASEVCVGDSWGAKEKYILENE